MSTSRARFAIRISLWKQFISRLRDGLTGTFLITRTLCTWMIYQGGLLTTCPSITFSRGFSPIMSLRSLTKSSSTIPITIETSPNQWEHWTRRDWMNCWRDTRIASSTTKTKAIYMALIVPTRPSCATTWCDFSRFQCITFYCRASSSILQIAFSTRWAINTWAATLTLETTKSSFLSSTPAPSSSGTEISTGSGKNRTRKLLTMLNCPSGLIMSSIKRPKPRKTFPLKSNLFFGWRNA